MSQRLIMHIDLDAFFASIEQRDHPEYQGRPLVVGAKPGRRGVVLSDQVQAFLDPQPLTVLRGLGEKSAPALQRLGLSTVADVRRLALLDLRRHLGELAGTKIHQQARGIASDKIHLNTERKSISKETTFNEDISDPGILRDTLHWAAQEVGYVARQAGRKGNQVTLKIRFRGFETHTRSCTLASPTSADQVLFNQARELYRSGGWENRAVRSIDRTGNQRLGERCVPGKQSRGPVRRGGTRE
jgi:DNA polymerase-4